ncbi:hypothetical protein ACHQM5_011821 [Ranunculus cassubicifolius]
MVFYFKARPDVGDFTIFMGLDKHENKDLIKYGFPEDICFRLLILFDCIDLVEILRLSPLMRY